jgi:hypothetical protein
MLLKSVPGLGGGGFENEIEFIIITTLSSDLF